MASTAMFAPYDPASAMARRIVAPITGNAYQIDPRGSALVDVSDVAWFQTQGFSVTPTASAGQSLMYAPYMADEGMTGPTTNPNTGNTYFINAAGAVAVATADIAWFQTQGYALVPTPGTGFSLMSTQIEVGQALSGPIFSPITGNMYVMNGQGWIIAATADVAWLQGQGFAPVASGGVAPPVFPPVVGATQATIAADFAGQQYWAAGASKASFAAWLTAIGGTYSRASSATYLQGGVVKTAAANAPRFPTDLGGVPQGIRLTGAATNLHIQSSISSSVASYNPTNGALTANAGTDPSGGSAAASFIPTVVANNHTIGLIAGVSLSASTTYTWSMFVKAIGANTYNVLLDPENGPNYSWFSLAGSGSVLGNAGSGVGSIQPLANGWFLLSVTFARTTTAAAVPTFYMSDAAGGTTPAADGTSGWLMWGMNFTATAFPCDYIPTTTATVTQAADVMVATPIPWYNVAASTLLVRANSIQQQTFAYLSGFSNGASLTAFFGIFESNVTAVANFSNGGPVGSYTDLSSSNYAIAQQVNDRSVSQNGTAAQTSAAVYTPPAVTELDIGNIGGGFNAYANISQIAVWGLRAPDTELVRLST